MLAACAGAPPAAHSPGQAAGQAPVSSPASESAPPTETESAAIAREAPASQPPAVDADPKRLVGLDGNELVAMLGNPEFRRKDPPAELWRYRTGACTLILFLYGPEKAASTDKRYLVRHVDARAPGRTSVTAADCLRALLQARGQKQAS